MPNSANPDELALLVADVYELAGALRSSGDRLAGRVGQTQARWQALSVASEGDWTVPGIASRLGVTRQAVQRVTDDLEAAGLIRYDENPAHKRSPLVRLTDEGRAVLEAITENSRAWRSAVADALTEQDVARTRKTLRALLVAIHESPIDLPE